MAARSERSTSNRSAARASSPAGGAPQPTSSPGPAAPRASWRCWTAALARTPSRAVSRAHAAGPAPTAAEPARPGPKSGRRPHEGASARRHWAADPSWCRHTRWREPGDVKHSRQRPTLGNVTRREIFSKSPVANDRQRCPGRRLVAPTGHTIGPRGPGHTDEAGQKSCSTHSSQRGSRATHTRRPWRMSSRLNRPRWRGRAPWR